MTFQKIIDFQFAKWFKYDTLGAKPAYLSLFQTPIFSAFEYKVWWHATSVKQTSIDLILHNSHRSLYFGNCNSTNLFHITQATIIRNYKLVNIRNPILSCVSIPKWNFLNILKSSHSLIGPAFYVCRCWKPHFSCSGCCCLSCTW